MAEVYVGTKFRTVFARRSVSGDERLGEMLKWCRRWAALGVVGDTVGNLSYRTMAGFLINRTAGDLAAVTRQECVEVIEADILRKELIVAGLYEPSSESMMHAGIYKARPDINAVFHGHSAAILANAGRLSIPVTVQEQSYGTPELVAEIQIVLGRDNFVVIRQHGFVSIGATMREAGERLEEMLTKL